MADETDVNMAQRVWGKTRDSVSGGWDKVTGREFRREFEDFTDAVTGSVLGVHRAGEAARLQLEQAKTHLAGLEQAIQALGTQQEGLRRDVAMLTKMQVGKRARSFGLAIVALMTGIAALATSIGALFVGLR
jgi:hypothetical protein